MGGWAVQTFGPRSKKTKSFRKESGYEDLEERSCTVGGPGPYSNSGFAIERSVGSVMSSASSSLLPFFFGIGEGHDVERPHSAMLPKSLSVNVFGTASGRSFLREPCFRPVENHSPSPGCPVRPSSVAVLLRRVEKHGEDRPSPKASSRPGWRQATAASCLAEVVTKAEARRAKPAWLRRGSAWLCHRCPAQKRGELHFCDLRKVRRRAAPPMRMRLPPAFTDPIFTPLML